jgi:hypothetical protein
VLQARADVRVVDRQGRRVPEALGQLELDIREPRVLAEPVDVQRALDRVARDERDRDQRLRVVGGRAGHDLHARIEMRLLREHRLAVLDRPARDTCAELGRRVEDLLGVLVAREHRQQHALVVVGHVDRECVVRDQLLQRVRDALEQQVDALLGEEKVEDIRQPTIRVDQPSRGRRPGHARAGPVSGTGSALGRAHVLAHRRARRRARESGWSGRTAPHVADRKVTHRIEGRGPRVLPLRSD